MLSRAYSEAAVDVLDILNHMEWNDFCKVSTKFIEFLEDNSASDYESKLDYSKGLEALTLSKEALGILAVIYRKYWCTDEERTNFDKQLLENEEKFREELRKKYDPDKLFEKSDISINDNGEPVLDNQALIVVDRDTTSIFTIILKKFKTMFKFLFE